MYNYNLHKISKHSELERIVESLDKKERQATFLLVTDWDEVCGKLLTKLRTLHHSPEFTNMNVYVLDSWDIPDGIAMIRESFDIKSRISKVPCLISIKDNNVAVYSNNDAVYRELGL
jgi:hypothetical protein